MTQQTGQNQPDQQRELVLTVVTWRPAAVGPKSDWVTSAQISLAVGSLVSHGELSSTPIPSILSHLILTRKTGEGSHFTGEAIRALRMHFLVQHQIAR